jgi:hypothetical protein
MCHGFLQEMDDDEWDHSNCLTDGGFPQLLWEALQHLGYNEPPIYHTREYYEGNTLVCELRLYMPAHLHCPAFRSRYITMFGREGHMLERSPTSIGRDMCRF